ncbi:hypothetical protein KZZ07_01950 [Mameliella sp. CS4]|uniref:leucine-rich repeat domain-containing protein n=1 Tax=Mameliella sp. CS4 TaxID=2862329 RepID=UPI001C605530|nr:leucine-rich repeat domain-containing protein [Mameliella sp. CS4]MBW4981291.1 hypothetical protein [Mameliella sp. CS4]
MEDEERLAGELSEVLRHVKMNRCDGLSLLTLSNPWFLTDLPDGLARLDWITWLDLEGTRITDLAPLASLTRMEKLDLRGTPVTDLSALSGMTHLRNLFLEGTEVADLAPLAACGRLREVWLDGTHVTDLAPLARCRGLRQLSIRRTGVTDLSPLKGLPELAVLDLTGSQVQDLRPVLGLPALCEGEGAVGISFEDTPVALRDRALARIAETEDPEVRASDLVDHLTGGARLSGWRGDA